MAALRPLAASLARRAMRLGWSALDAAGLWRSDAPPVAYVVEKADWSIRWDGIQYARAIEAAHPGTVVVTERPERLFRRVAHFGSQFLWELWAKAASPTNPVVVTYFHGKPEDGPDMARHVDYFMNNLNGIDRVVTAAGVTESRLLEWGVPAEKLVRVPLGVDTALFHPPTEEERATARARLGAPEGAVCIGSFQKDGVGWGDGMEPKLIKGPDILVEAAAKLARDIPVFVLLTGPARGYVKAGLERHGVPYHHLFVEDFPDLARCYHALDLYLVTSREEGGPKAILEGMASGVPVVTTRVGMADDLVEDGLNGALVSVEDVAALTEKAAGVVSDDGRAERMRARGRNTAERHDWEKVGEMLYEKAYRPLLSRSPFSRNQR